MATNSPNAAERQDSPSRGLLRAFKRLLQKGKRFSPKGKKDAASDSEASTSSGDSSSKSPATNTKLKLPRRPSNAKADDEMTPPPPCIRYGEARDGQALPDRTVSRRSLNKRNNEAASDSPSKAKGDQAPMPLTTSPAAKSKEASSDSPLKEENDQPDPAPTASSPSPKSKESTSDSSSKAKIEKAPPPVKEVERVKIPLRNPDYEAFVDAVPKNDALVSHAVVRAWFKSWFDVDETFESDIGVERFTTAIWMDGSLLHRVSEKGLGDYMGAINLQVGGGKPMFDQTVIDNFVADILYAKREYEWKRSKTEGKKADTSLRKKFDMQVMQMQKERYMKSFRDYVEGENKKEKKMMRGGDLGDEGDEDELLRSTSAIVASGQVVGEVGDNGGNGGA